MIILVDIELVSGSLGGVSFSVLCSSTSESCFPLNGSHGANSYATDAVWTSAILVSWLNLSTASSDSTL